MLRDPSFFSWHPVYLAVSLLAGTPFHLAIIDVDAFFLFMLTTAGFVTLAHFLRREMSLTISDAWVMFYAMSYTYSMIALTTGASWLTFLGNISALPWLALGILQRSGWKGVGLVLLFCLHQILGGHLSPTVSNSIFLSFFALGMSMSRRSVVPLANWFIGYALAVIVLIPLLFPVVEGFFESIRSQGVVLKDMQDNNIPAEMFPMSLFFGIALWLTHPYEMPGVTYILSLASSAAAWCLLPALVPPVAALITRFGNGIGAIFSGHSTNAHKKADAAPSTENGSARWRGLEIVSLVMMIIIAILICRPVWITETMMQLPLFRSMRWPFRELVQFEFFLHLFLLIRPAGFKASTRIYTAIFGTCLFVIPLVLYPVPPTFNSMTWDRELVLTGGVNRFWEQVRPFLKPDDRVAVIIPLDVYGNDRFEEPYSLLGTYNYAEVANVINAWGYSPTVPRDQVYTKTYAYYPFGAYRPFQKKALLDERPDLKFITLESLHPLRITLSSRNGPEIDLTPFVPERHSKVVERSDAK